jgi:sterol desaturase/sphingolipid hydroxylase (fatty acid hydroxylase superfamily)
LCASLLTVALLETARPWRRPEYSTAIRWAGNLTLFVIGSAGVTVLAPWIAPGFSRGPLASLGAPPWLEIAAGIALLDLLDYFVHRMFHAVPLLWRLHALHHSDPEVDLTTSLRHHPLEVWTVAVVKYPIGLVFGLAPATIFTYGLIVVVMQTVQHANLAVPARCRRLLSWVVITPDLHRIHHSTEPAEGSSNFADILPLWDRLFGTFRATPAVGSDRIVLGLAEHREPRELALHRMLAMPVTLRRTARRAAN